MQATKFLIKTFFAIVLTLIVLMAAAVVAFVGFGMEKRPLVSPTKQSFEDFERVKYLLKENRPDKLKEAGINRLALTGKDITLLLNHGLTYIDGSAGKVDLNDRNIVAHLTLPLPEKISRSYLNLSASMAVHSDRLRFDELKIGRLPIPSAILNSMIPMIHGTLKYNEGYRRLFDQISRIDSNRDMIMVEYRWREELKEELKAKARDLLITDRDKEVLKVYTDRLREIVKSIPSQTVSLADLLGGLFVTAKERSATGKTAREENQALILALAMYVQGTDVDKLLGRASQGSTRRLDIRLNSRSDLAQHFIVSAAIAVKANTRIADAIGLYKEIDDSLGGTGFSFADLAADRAGVGFAKLATGSDGQAAALQTSMCGKPSETDFMPRTDGLPESIMKLQFKKRYKDLGSSEYELVETEIKNRIANCRIFRKLS